MSYIKLDITKFCIVEHNNELILGYQYGTLETSIIDEFMIEKARNWGAKVKNPFMSLDHIYHICFKSEEEGNLFIEEVIAPLQLMNHLINI